MANVLLILADFAFASQVFDGDGGRVISPWSSTAQHQAASCQLPTASLQPPPPLKSDQRLISDHAGSPISLRTVQCLGACIPDAQPTSSLQLCETQASRLRDAPNPGTPRSWMRPSRWWTSRLVRHAFRPQHGPEFQVMEESLACPRDCIPLSRHSHLPGGFQKRPRRVALVALVGAVGIVRTPTLKHTSQSA